MMTSTPFFALILTFLPATAAAPTLPLPRPLRARFPTSNNDPFAPLDPQTWTNPDAMTWADYLAPPNTTWSDPAHRGYSRNFNIALITVDYPDAPFAITLPARSDLYGNPQPLASGLRRKDVPAFYRDLLNVPSELNQGHTLHEYWMGDSFGRYGVDLTVFGAYRMPALRWQYGVDDERNGFNEGACPIVGGLPCSVDLRTDALGAWRRDVGNATADAFELAFILSAGQDESSTWQEFGEMKFDSPQDVPAAFGPPNITAGGNASNSANTRYVPWTSWAAASAIWPNAGGGSSTQAESSGMATFAHELSHLLGIGDNYNNPYSDPARRAYTGPFSMLDRGSFNGPGGPHTRWQIPPVQGASMGSLHTMRDKRQIGLIDSTPVLQLSRAGLASSGPVVAELTARSVDPSSVGGLMGLNISFGAAGDLSPRCNVSTDPLCDGGRYNNYNVEVIDRMGADSFQPDAGVLISKTKDSDRTQPFQWVVDANPQDAGVVDFFYPNGTARYWSVGDYRQLVDALFHAGTRSGSEFEWRDEANGVHLYVLDVKRDEMGVLRYTVGAAATVGNGTANTYGANLGEGTVERVSNTTSSVVYCAFTLTNTGRAGNATSEAHFQDVSKYLGSDIYRLSAEIEGAGAEGWKIAVPNALAVARFGAEAAVRVAVGREEGYATVVEEEVVVVLTASSESDKAVVAVARCKVKA